MQDVFINEEDKEKKLNKQVERMFFFNSLKNYKSIYKNANTQIITKTWFPSLRKTKTKTAKLILDFINHNYKINDAFEEISEKEIFNEREKALIKESVEGHYEGIISRMKNILSKGSKSEKRRLEVIVYEAERLRGFKNEVGRRPYENIDIYSILK